MGNENILDDIPFDDESHRIRTKVWSFTKERAVEKALNRIDYKAKSMGRPYLVLESPTKESINPDDPSEGWECLMIAQLL